MKLAAGVLVTTAPPTDPLGPVGQDADEVRNEACRIVTQDSGACTPVTVTTPPRPNEGGPSSSIDFAGSLLWVVLAVAVVALLVMLVRWRGKGARAQRQRAHEHSDDGDVVEQRVVAVDRSKEPGDWRAEADEHRRAGRFRDAVRCRYRALVGDLARRGVIDEIPGRTTGEHRRQMHEVRPAAAATFDEAAELFDGAWYGHVAVDALDLDRFSAMEREVLAAAEVRR